MKTPSRFPWKRTVLMGLSIFFLIGCQGTMLSYKGARIRDGYQIAIKEGGRQSGYHQSADLTIDYEYMRRGDELRIGGTVGFADSIRYNFNVIQRFNLGLVLADAQGNILEQRALTSASLRDPDDALRFNNVIKLPPQTALMAFTYTGRATEGQSSGRGRRGGVLGDGGDGVDTEFWEHPIVR